MATATAVTLQLAAGYTLTTATIWLVPELVSRVGWHWAFLVLAPGPFLGTVAMRRLGQLTWGAGGHGEPS
jgi:hypothetical protein